LAASRCWRATSWCDSAAPSTKFHPGLNVGIGKDDTLYAKVKGHVVFEIKGRRERKTVRIVPD
jgi:ribosomal protein L27